MKLPGGKSLVVDSKASFAAYLDAIQAEDDESKRVHLGRHAKLVRDHMTSLAQKQYWKQFDPAPEFVIMFLPDESSFRAALDHDPGLLEAGFEAGVIPASPATLIAVLRTVATVWQHETAAESARAVSRLGRELYDRLGIFAGHLAGVGKSLDAAARNYNSAVGSFETRVLVTARKFPELGTGGDELPEIPPVLTQPRPVLATAGDEKQPPDETRPEMPQQARTRRPRPASPCVRAARSSSFRPVPPTPPDRPQPERERSPSSSRLMALQTF